MKKKFELKRWEIALILLSGTLFLASFTVYVTGFPLRNYLFGLQEDTTATRIGRLREKSGEVRRQIVGQAEFKSVDKDIVLYKRDTIITSDGSSATVSLDDGGTIELGPKTMVKLETETDYTFSGVTRTTFVNVVTGQLTGSAASSANSVVIRTADEDIVVPKGIPKTVLVSVDQPKAFRARPRRISNASKGLLSGLPILKLLDRVQAPVAPPRPPPELKPVAIALPLPSATPTPTPTRTSAPIPRPSPSPSPKPSPSPRPSPAQIKPEFGVRLVEPAANARLTVTQGSEAPEKSIAFQWRTLITNRARRVRIFPTATLTVYKFSDSDREKKEQLFQKSVPSQIGPNTLSWVATAPGNYEWQVQIDNSKRSGRFSMGREFEGIQLLQPESLKRSNDPSLPWLERNKPRVKLEWKPYASATDYTLRLTGKGGGKPTVVKLSAHEYTIVQKSLDQTEMRFEVIAALPGGFIVHSPKSRFIFDFTPPDPVTPAQMATLKNADQLWDRNGVLLTWQKTGVSEAYGLEIARDGDFKDLIVRKTIKDNFFIFRPKPLTMTYWWRVRAYAKKTYTPPSAAFQFTVVK